MTNNVDPDQTTPIGAVCSGSTLFASIQKKSVILGNYLQRTTSADDIFRCIFFLGVPIGAVCSGSTLFASLLNSSVMQGNYLQQTTSADDIFRCIFFLALLGLSPLDTYCFNPTW